MRTLIALSVAAFAPTALAAAQDLLGIANNFDVPDSNDLYAVSTENASMELLGQITPRFEPPLISLERAPNGTYFGTTIHYVMTVDLGAGTAEEFFFAGDESYFVSGLDFSPTGFGYVTTVPFAGGGPTHFNVFNPDTGEIIESGNIQDLDVWEVAFRPDGVLLGFDNATNDVWQIDPFTGDVEFMFSLAPGIGDVLAMTTFGDESFLLGWEGFDPDAPRKLYDFDLYTGETTLIGQIDPNALVLGLALVPSPSGAALMALAGVALARRRR